MDDMIGTMLDIDDSVKKIMEWIAENGGFEKNALYITADHDHYVTLLDDFPKTLANLVIEGKSHEITPQSKSNVNPWSATINAGRHEDDTQTQTEHINDFSTWSDEDIATVSHFWGPRGSGGNGRGSHSTRPVPLFHAGDDGCLEALKGRGFHVLGRDVEGAAGKVDQMHLSACMQTNMLVL
jgi:alkaline phosphatase